MKTRQQLHHFSNKLAHLLKSGLSLNKALALLIQSSNDKCWRILLQNILNALQHGKSLQHSLQQYPQYFDANFCALVHIGEHSGRLTQLLEEYSRLQQQLSTLKQRCKKALFYPISMLVVSVAVSIFLLMVIVPQFTKIYSSFDATLPWITQLAINLSNKLPTLLLLGVSALISAFILAKYWQRRQPHGITITSYLLWRTPGLNRLYRAWLRMQWCQRVSTLLSSGIPLAQALSICSECITQPILQQQLQQAAMLLRQGQSLSIALRPLLADEQLEILSLTQHSEAFSEHLDHIAKQYQQQLLQRLDVISTLLEPILLLLLSSVMGGLIVAMYLPIFHLGSII